MIPQVRIAPLLSNENIYIIVLMGEWLKITQSFRFDPSQIEMKIINATEVLKTHSYKRHLTPFFKGELSITNNTQLKALSKQPDLKEGIVKRSLLQIYKKIISNLILLFAKITNKCSFYDRVNNIYNLSYEIQIKFEKISKDTPNNSTNQSQEFNITLSFQKSTAIEDKLKGSMQNDYLANFYKQCLGEQTELYNKIIILKGKGSVYYIIYLEDSLGSGSYGDVFKSQSFTWSDKQQKLLSGEWAIKFCKTNYVDKDNKVYISPDREHQTLRIMQKMTKKKGFKAMDNVIFFYEQITQNKKSYIVYQYCLHNSLKRFVKKAALTHRQIYQIAQQLANVLKLIHYDLIKTKDQFYEFSMKVEKDTELQEDNELFKQKSPDEQKGIIHRDLKLQNILVKEISKDHIVIKVIDWALSKRTFTHQSINKVNFGTSAYQSPEMKRKQLYSCKSDIWAYGVIIHNLIFPKPFTPSINPQQIQEEQFSAINSSMESTSLLQINQEQKKFWKQLIKGTLNPNPKLRWSAKTLNDYFLQNTIQKCVDRKIEFALKGAKDALVCQFTQLQRQLPQNRQNIRKLFYGYANKAIQTLQHLIERKSKIITPEMDKQQVNPFSSNILLTIIKGLAQNFQKTESIIKSLKWIGAQYFI